MQKHHKGIDEHPETLKTCRRSAIGTRDRAIIGNRSALMDRYRGSFPLRSLFFLFYPSLQMTWKNAEEDEEEEKKDGSGEREGGEGEEVAEKSLNHAPSEYGRNYCRRLMSRCSRDASSLYEESSSSSLSSPPSIFHRSHREKTTNSFRETGNSQVSILLFSCC